MKLSLRAARKLETKIGTYVDENPLNLTTKVRVNTDLKVATASLDEARKEFIQNEEDMTKLLQVKYILRQKISDENAKSEIDSLITQKVSKEQQVSRIKKLINAPIREAEEAVSDMLTLGKTNFSKGEVRYGESSVHTNLSFLIKEDVEKFKKQKNELSKEIEQIDEKVTELNHTQKVDLDDETVKLLQRHSLL